MFASDILKILLWSELNTCVNLKCVIWWTTPNYQQCRRKLSMPHKHNQSFFPIRALVDWCNKLSTRLMKMNNVDHFKSNTWHTHLRIVMTPPVIPKRFDTKSTIFSRLSSMNSMTGWKSYVTMTPVKSFKNRPEIASLRRNCSNATIFSFTAYWFAKDISPYKLLYCVGTTYNDNNVQLQIHSDTNLNCVLVYSCVKRNNCYLLI